MMYKVFLADDEPWVMLGIKNLIDWEKKVLLFAEKRQMESKRGNESAG